MRIGILTAAALALAASACSAEKEADGPAPEATQAATPAGRAAVYAAAEKDPEAFVRALYAYLAEPRTTPDPAEASIAPGRDPLYSRTMNALIGVDDREAAARNDSPRLVYDPICACQDSEGLTLQTATVTPDGPQAATVDVVFTLGPRRVSQTLKLLKEGPMWRVADVIDDQGKSLHDELMAIAEKANS